VTEFNKDPAPVPGLHLVKTNSREDESMASDVVDILQDGLRGGTDTDTGGVEAEYQTTLATDEAKRTEAEFFRAIADKLKLRVGDWANGKKGVAFGELGTRDGWRIGLYDRDGRLFEIELRYSEIQAIAAQQRAKDLSNFEHMLDRIVAKFQEARRTWFARRDGVSLQ
jgi:hypothetical protein